MSVFEGDFARGPKRTVNRRHAEAVMAKGDCTVQMMDEKGEKQVATLTIKSGEHVDLRYTRISCKDGEVAISKAPTHDVGEEPVLVIGPEETRGASEGRKE